MTAKQVIFDSAARHALHEGVDTVARAVRTTLGPKGRNVALATQWGAPAISPDGVTVADAIELKDRFENMGAQLVKQAARKTGDVAGDGTTSSTVLAQAIVDEGLKLVSAGASPLLLKRALDQDVRMLVAEIARHATPIKDRREIAQVATVSALDAQIGDMLAAIMDKAGRDAVITVEEGKGTTLEYELVEGMQFERGYLSPYFVTDSAKMVAELEKPAILITDQAISAIDELLPLLETLLQGAKKELLIIAEDVSGDALATLVVNSRRGILSTLAVKAPGFGDRRKAWLQDIAVMTGATVISPELGRALDSVSMADLGYARRVHSDKDSTIIVEGFGDRQAIQTRIAQITQQAAVASSDYDKEQLKERAARLAGGVAVIKVGAPTEPAMKERTARVDDALHATRAAIAEGIVPGGGVAYLNLQAVLATLPATLEEDGMAVSILRHALEEPARQIAANAGLDGAVVVSEIKRRQQASGNPALGFDVMRGEYGDLVAWGVLDPAMVVRAALENAVSVAGMILSTDTLIAEMPGAEADGSE